MFNLENKVAVITGGNGGLGLAYARGLIKQGCSVAIWARNTEKNEQAVKQLTELNADAAAFQCDVTDEASVKTAFDQTLERFGKIDICFANAGGGGFRGLSHLTDRKDWLATIDLNLLSVVHTFAPISEHLLERGEGGKLIVTSSVAALLGTGGAAGYSTTKAAVRGLVQALAIELGQAGIQVNAILPGYIETEMSVQTSDAFKEACSRRSAIGRIGKLDDMEGIAVFLASQQSNFMTGQSVVLDGGHTIHPM